jgi:hypothetical protein
MAADDADLYLDALADLRIVVEEMAGRADATVEFDDRETQVTLGVVERRSPWRAGPTLRYPLPSQQSYP